MARKNPAKKTPASKPVKAKASAAPKAAPAAKAKPSPSSREGRGMAKVSMQQKDAEVLQVFCSAVIGGKLGEAKPARAAGSSVLGSVSKAVANAPVIDKVRGNTILEVDVSKAGREYFRACLEAWKGQDKKPFKMPVSNVRRLESVAEKFASAA